jgi:hypothetical protein
MTMETHDLERELAALGAHIDMPRERDLAAVVRRRIETVPARRRLPLPLVWTRRSILIAVALVLVAASAAVATYFGVRGVRVRIGETPPPTATASVGASLNLGEPTDLAAARAEVSFAVGVPTALGPPDETYLGRALPGYRVTLLYRPRPGLPEAGETGAGLLLFEFVGNVERGALDKFVEPGQVREVRVDGAYGLWIEGPHTISWRDRAGNMMADTVRLSGNVLLWERGAVTYRLESATSLQEALRIARSVR